MRRGSGAEKKWAISCQKFRNFYHTPLTVGPGGRRHAPPTLCKAVAFSERKREMSSAEADTLHASAMCSETVHTAAVLKGTRSFLTDITAHRLRLPCRRDAPTSYHIKTIRRDHPTNASQYRGHATSCLWCKGDRLAKRCGAVGRSRLRNVGTFSLTPFTVLADY